MPKTLCAMAVILSLVGCGTDDPSSSLSQSLTQCSCPLIEAIVCGADGVAYTNSCFAACHGVDVLHDGQCTFNCPAGDLPVCAYNPSTQSTATFSNILCYLNFSVTPENSGWTVTNGYGACCKASDQSLYQCPDGTQVLASTCPANGGPLQWNPNPILQCPGYCTPGETGYCSCSCYYSNPGYCFCTSCVCGMDGIWIYGQTTYWDLDLYW